MQTEELIELLRAELGAPIIAFLCIKFHWILLADGLFGRQNRILMEICRATGKCLW